MHYVSRRPNRVKQRPMSSFHALSAIFLHKTVPVLRLPASLVAKVRAGSPRMGDFHAGMISNILTVEKGQLSMHMSPEHEKKHMESKVTTKPFWVLSPKTTA